MPVCEKRKLAFCHIPRTGGVSVSNALNLKVIDKHYPASWYREKFPDYTLFTVIRPYDQRIRSAMGWAVPDRRKKDAYSLDELVASIISNGIDNFRLMLKPNEYFLDVPVDFELRFSHLQRDLNNMLSMLGIDTVTLEIHNTFK